MMHEAVPVMRPLQNHLPVVRHLTTQAGLWTPQYLQQQSEACKHNIRGGRNNQSQCCSRLTSRPKLEVYGAVLCVVSHHPPQNRAAGKEYIIEFRAMMHSVL